MKKSPIKIYYNAPSGYKGTGSHKKLPLTRLDKDHSIDIVGVNKYNKGFRIYTRYANRYGIMVRRSPTGNLRKFNEQFG